MAKYLVYVEWDNGTGWDREVFETLTEAREWAQADIDAGVIEVAYIEYVDPKYSQPLTRENRWDDCYEIGACTVETLKPVTQPPSAAPARVFLCDRCLCHTAEVKTYGGLTYCVECYAKVIDPQHQRFLRAFRKTN